MTVERSEESQQPDVGNNGAVPPTPHVDSTVPARTRILSHDGSRRVGLLNALMTTGVAAGVTGGLLAREYLRPFNKRELMYVFFPGEMFLRLLGQATLPLITASIVAAVGSASFTLASHAAITAAIYFVITTVIAEAIGLALSLTIEPGRYNPTVEGIEYSTPNVTFQVLDVVLDILRNMAPPNVIEACLYTWKTHIIGENNASDHENRTESTADYRVDIVPGTNIPGLLICSVIIGLVLSSQSERRGASLIRVFRLLADAVLVSIQWFMWYGPVAVAFLIAHQILAAADPLEKLRDVSLYLVTMLVGMIFHIMVILPAFSLAVVGPRKQGRLFASMISPALTAFATSSSAVTIPVTISSLEDGMGVDPRVARFIVPVGASLNMDGTAIYEAVSAVFLAQRRCLVLSPGLLLSVAVAAFLASAATAAVPGGGIVTMIIVVQALGLPPEDVGIIVTVDWLMDRMITVVNVLSDAVGAVVVQAICRRGLRESPRHTPVAL